MYSCMLKKKIPLNVQFPMSIGRGTVPTKKKKWKTIFSEICTNFFFHRTLLELNKRAQNKRMKGLITVKWTMHSASITDNSHNNNFNCKIESDKKKSAFFAFSFLYSIRNRNTHIHKKKEEPMNIANVIKRANGRGNKLVQFMNAAADSVLEWCNRISQFSQAAITHSHSQKRNAFRNEETAHKKMTLPIGHFKCGKTQNETKNAWIIWLEKLASANSSERERERNWIEWQEPINSFLLAFIECSFFFAMQFFLLQQQQNHQWSTSVIRWIFRISSNYRKDYRSIDAKKKNPNVENMHLKNLHAAKLLFCLQFFFFCFQVHFPAIYSRVMQIGWLQTRFWFCDRASTHESSIRFSIVEKDEN